MDPFERVAVVDSKIKLSLAAGVIPFAASVLIGAAVFGDVRAFRVSVVVGIVLWAVIAVAVYRRLPS